MGRVDNVVTMMERSRAAAASRADEPVFGSLEAADGTPLRHARWARPGAERGTVVLLNGRTEFIEKYRETAAALLDRGFAVETLDWRGQGLSGGRMADNPQKHHVADFDLLADDLDRFVGRVVAPRAEGPLLLMAHSMGGLVATLHLARRPAQYSAVILSAPMHDIHTGSMPRWLVGAIAGIACRLGRATDYAPTQRDYDPGRDAPFLPANAITSDRARWRVYHDAFRDRPELRLGGVTYGWLRAALAASDRVQCELPLGKVGTPVLLLSAPGDQVVNAAAHEVVIRRFPNGTIRRYPDSRHEPLMERDEIRDAVWADIDAFLARAGL